MRQVSKGVVKLLFLFVLFTLVFWVYYTSNVRDRGDSRYVLHVADSILRQGNTDLDEYQFLIHQEGIYESRVLIMNGHIYSVYPMGTSLLSVPFVAYFNSWYKSFVAPVGIDKFVVLTQTDKLDIFLAALFSTLAILFIFLIGIEFLPWPISFMVSLAFAFGTTAWTSGARTLWPHGPTMLMLSMGIWLLLKAKREVGFAVLAGFPLAYSFVIRPTNIFPLIALSVYVLLAYRKLFPFYFIVCLSVLMPLIYYNVRIYQTPLSPFYYPQGISMGAHNHSLLLSWEGLIGQLMSPNRGLFIFSPFLIFSFIGVFTLFKLKKAMMIDYLLIFSIISHWLIISYYRSWWGGWVFGPRYFTDILPILAYFFIRFVQNLIVWRHKILKVLTVLVLLASVVVSIWIEHAGATYYATGYWNGNPNDIDYYHERVWNWHDLQFLRR